MKIFGRIWDEKSDIGQQYRRHIGKDSPARILHYPYETRALLYDCDICRLQFRHWLCDDKEWQKLPKALHNKVLCLSCYRCARYLTKKGN